MQKRTLIPVLSAFLLFCFTHNQAWSQEKVIPENIEGQYVLYDSPQAEGTAKITPNGNKAVLNIDIHSLTSDGLCSWSGTIDISDKLQSIYDADAEGNVVVKLEADSFEVNGPSGICGMGAYLSGHFLKIGGEAYSNVLKQPYAIPPFSHINKGNVIEYSALEGRYTLEIDQVVETFTIKGKTSDPIFKQIEHTMKWAKVYDPTRLPQNFTVAILQDEHSNVGFVSISEEDLYIQEIKEAQDKLIASVCLDETDNCFALVVSQGNPLLKKLRANAATYKQKSMGATFTWSGELLELH